MEHERQADRPARKVAEQVRAMPPWKKVLLGVSIALMAAGLALQAYAYATRPAPAPAQPAAAASSSSAASGTAAPSGGQPARRSAAVPGSGFLPSGTGGGESSAPREASPAPAPGAGDASAATDVTAPAWQPALFRLGFSFFAGFCIAFALRLFFKAAVAFIGLVLLAAFALQYAGLVNIDWSSIAGHADGVMAWAKDQFASLRHFITGQLPSAGSAVAGLYVGWRKN